MLDQEKDLLEENQEAPETSEADAPTDTTTTEAANEAEADDTSGGESGQTVEALQADNTELRNKYLRLLAEFENYKKRTMRERVDLMNTAAQATMSALLPVLDDFDRAKKNAESEASTESFSEGVVLVYQKLYSNLKQRGLVPMESDGATFDPELHEALTEIPAPNPEQVGTVIDTIEKGYQLNGKIIRHAKVVVGK